MTRDVVMRLTLDEITVGDSRRPVDADAVKRLAASIKEIGLQHPVTVRSVKGSFVLVAGRHRLEAVRSLGDDNIPAVVVKLDDTDARLWEISENLHRSDLTKQERADQIAEWVRLTGVKREKDRVSAQPEPKPMGGRPESGLNAASRELGIDRNEVQRAVQIASISEDAKEAAREAGLDDNQSALLKVARADQSKQVDVVRDIAESRALKIEQDIQNRAAQEVAEMLAEHIPGELWDGLKANLHAAGKVNAILAAFNNLIGQSVMDRRYGS